MPKLEDKDVEVLVGLVQEAQPIMAKAAAQKPELEKLAPALVDSLIKAGELDAAQRDQAIQNVINDPVKVAMCLKSTADLLIEKQQKQAAPASMGSGAEINKTAGVETKPRSAADHAFLTRLGLA